MVQETVAVLGAARPREVTPRAGEPAGPPGRQRRLVALGYADRNFSSGPASGSLCPLRVSEGGWGPSTREGDGPGGRPAAARVTSRLGFAASSGSPARGGTLRAACAVRFALLGPEGQGGSGAGKPDPAVRSAQPQSSRAGWAGCCAAGAQADAGRAAAAGEGGASRAPGLRRSWERHRPGRR